VELIRSLIRVLVIDDHPIFRQGVRHVIDAEDGMQVLAEVGSVHDALHWLADHRADVALLDHALPGVDGVTGLPLLFNAQQDLQVIVFTVSDDDELFRRAMHHGACGYLLKDAPPEKMLEAIRSAADGECTVSPRLLRHLFNGWGREPQAEVLADGREWPRRGAPEAITGRERQVLEYLVQGLSNKEIARALGLSPHTVRNQLQRLQERLQARNRVQLAILAREMGCS
jgi:DNA-binding NarL/FixJ family response regulator